MNTMIEFERFVYERRKLFIKYSPHNHKKHPLRYFSPQIKLNTNHTDNKTNKNPKLLNKLNSQISISTKHFPRLISS